MKFVQIHLNDAYLIQFEPHEDERGSFTRAFCHLEFQARGLETGWVQTNLSANHKRGTLRGLHYQAPPFEEVKLVQCLRGSIYDVIVDLREDSPTRGQWFAAQLSRSNLLGIYVPKGFAHGFQTLEDDSDILYFMSEFYVPEASSGIRWDDPTLAIPWPHREPILSQKDQGLPVLK